MEQTDALERITFRGQMSLKRSNIENPNVAQKHPDMLSDSVKVMDSPRASTMAAQQPRMLVVIEAVVSHRFSSRLATISALPSQCSCCYEPQRKQLCQRAHIDIITSIMSTSAFSK